MSLKAAGLNSLNEQGMQGTIDGCGGSGGNGVWRRRRCRRLFAYEDSILARDI